MTETEYTKRRAGLANEVKRTEEEYGAAAMAESDDFEEKREAFETAQRNLERHDAAWEAGAKARHIAAEEEAEKQAAERARRMYATVDSALTAIESLAGQLDAKAAEVGELAAQVQDARSAFFGSLAGLPLADRESLANIGQWLLKPDDVGKLFASVADRFYNYELTDSIALGPRTANAVTDIRDRAARIAGVELKAEAAPARERVQKQERAKANPEDFDAVASESGFWMPGVRFHPKRVPHQMPPWSLPVKAEPADNPLP
jgi:hypothetical protein